MTYPLSHLTCRIRSTLRSLSKSNIWAVVVYNILFVYYGYSLSWDAEYKCANDLSLVRTNYGCLKAGTEAFQAIKPCRADCYVVLPSASRKDLFRLWSGGSYGRSRKPLTLTITRDFVPYRCHYNAHSFQYLTLWLIPVCTLPCSFLIQLRTHAAHVLAHNFSHCRVEYDG